MHLRTLSIENFRAIESIDVEFTERVNVVVGPNAVGKTTILEAIRLPKAVLAPRTQNESAQALISMGAVSPHNPQQLIAEAIARDPLKPVIIRCGYQLNADEIATVADGQQQLVTRLIRSRLNDNLSPANFAAFLSSQAGQSTLQEASKEIAQGLERLQAMRGICRLDLLIDFRSSQISTPDPTGAAIIAFLDERLSPEETKFSYFPADRALPRGEQPIQLGIQDAVQQLEAHNSQPQSKYNRLKNTIFNAIVGSESGRNAIRENFERIFSGVLKGRELVGAGVNQYGLLTINVRDLESGRVFDIDAMSSGEKGLILTFLLIERTLANGGVALLDEPELHLNPAVCKDILAFMVDAYAIRKDLQVILCSHSPEILAGTFGREECALFHLVSGTLLSRVRRSDGEAVAEALRQLGTSESEGLLYKATIFVEGEHDVELLELGFGSILRQHKLKDLGGRTEVEKQIRQLQEAEKSGVTLTPRYFIFDKDDVPTNLESSSNIKVLQWDRRCLENYLIDVDILTTLLKDTDIVRTPIASEGELSRLLKQLALGHLDDAVVKEVYDGMAYENPGRRPRETSGKTFEEVSAILYGRLEQISQQISGLHQRDWQVKFVRMCEARKAELLPLWDAEWKERCDGKRLFRELQQNISMKIPMRSFKRRIMERMRGVPTTDNWRAIEGLLKQLIA
ncbi:AAA family ATPase [Sinorhizobium terangae]|uniref:AAA family ATPase n=2 Tax=Sinorhizobium terangae TaxID=110322 RepID=A0A6N7LK04_SINTE|nr:AAA family ATPase [Sinorhizobium terangae]MBB4185682.1 putative ATPase [Sinorhizobium terangae]MQX17548.1 AAA family ATPase [Sinorhizobium terangae]WFU46260.1 AAA family ATPase [Sinorhizobium terangae]